MPMNTLCVVFFISVIAFSSVLTQSVLLTHKNRLSTRSEAVLSGADMHHSTIDEVIANLGKPSRVISPSHSYEWDKKTCWLRIVIGESGSIEMIEVRGTHPDSEIGTTDRGLKLGATIGDARRIYSPFHFEGTVPENTV